MGLRNLLFIVITSHVLCAACRERCHDTELINTSKLDSSFVEIYTGQELLFSKRFHPCQTLGYTSTWINHPDTSLYQPFVTMDFDNGSDFLFNVYFKNTDIPIDHDPDFSTLVTMLERALEYGFNNSPHIGDIIFFIQCKGKRYANSWDDEAMGLASPPYIRDRTGLNVDVIEHEVVQNDCRTGEFPSVRMIADVEGYLVTSDMSDSLWIHGRMDFLMAT